MQAPKKKRSCAVILDRVTKDAISFRNILSAVRTTCLWRSYIDRGIPYSGYTLFGFSLGAHSTGYIVLHTDTLSIYASYSIRVSWSYVCLYVGNRYIP